MKTALFAQRLIWIPTRICLRLFSEFAINGTDNIRQLDKGVIFASNHLTEFDPILIVSALPFRSSCMPIIFITNPRSDYRTSHSGIRRHLYSSYLLRLIGGIEALKGIRDYEKSLSPHIQLLEGGSSIAVFPVGKRHSKNEHKDAKGGVVYLSARTGKPIVPVKIIGLKIGLKPWHYIMNRKKITISFGKPFHYDEFAMNAKDLGQYRKTAIRLMDAIEEL